MSKSLPFQSFKTRSPLRIFRMMEAQTELYNYMGIKPNAVIALEIGGGNGLQGMILGGSSNMDIPCVDGDWMGRAYPVAWQTTPVVFETKPVFLPSTICDGNGNVMVRSLLA
jgi:DUF917 family protein